MQQPTTYSQLRQLVDALKQPEPARPQAPKDLDPDDFYVWQGEEELADVIAKIEEQENKSR